MTFIASLYKEVQSKASSSPKAFMEMERQEIKQQIDEFDSAEKWVHDSSLDHKGRLPPRASTGVWRASIFIIAIEFSERLSYFGLSTSLIIYLMKVLHQDLATAAKNVNYWSGVTTLMPLLGGFLADSYLGRYTTVFISAIIYLSGLTLLTMSWFVPSLKACEDNNACVRPRNVHEVVFFIAIYLVSVGTGGHKPALESFGADQFDDDHPEERKKKMSYFNWWNFGLCSGLLLGVTVIVYVQEHVNWGTADIFLTAVMAISVVIFVIGRPFYRFRVPTGTPFTPMLRVIVAAVAKRNLPAPANASELYEEEKPERSRGRLLCHTEKLKFLDKAAIVEYESGSMKEKHNLQMLSTVTEVEEVKLLLNMVPIWLVSLPFGICVAQAPTFFIKQGTVLDRTILNGFIIPPATIYALTAIGMITSVVLYERLLVPTLRRATGNERGLNILQRMGIGMAFSILTMVVAALVERRRLAVMRDDPVNGSLSMSVFWLSPQLVIIGFGDGFTLVGLQEYFYDQVPDSMRSLGIALYLSVIGAANFLSSVVITVINHLTSTGNGHGWIGKDLQTSRLDNFYWVLAGMASLNLLLFMFLAKRYSYKKVHKMNTAGAVADCYHNV